jgi:hypothetical protein
MNSRTAWGDYFTGSPTLVQTKEYGTRQTYSSTSVYVSNCLFRSITSGSSGGALYCSSMTDLLVETSSFFSCKTSGSHAGGIYFSGSQCVLYKVCGNDCSATDGHFDYIIGRNAASNKNYVNYSSIVRCVNENMNSYNTLVHLYGKIYFPSVNVSINKCGYRSGIYYSPISDSNCVTCSSTHSSFADNIATDCTCIYFSTGGAKYEIKSCNILRNTQGNLDSYGTIWTYGNVMIEDSCILENAANRIFHQSSSNTITLSNCTVDSTSNNGRLTTKNTVTKSFILALNHMSTRNCNSEYDSAGTLTPVVQFSSPSNKEIHCRTYVKYLYHLPQGNFLLLISIFHFIHPYDFSYPLVLNLIPL